MISFDEAQRLALALSAPLSDEEITLDGALGRIPSQALIAHETLVPFPRSAMDGFAVRAADTAAAPLTLSVTGAIFAGFGAEQTLAPMTAAQIATGAPLPAGADAVLPIELAGVRNGSVDISSPLRAGEHVFPPGEDALPGDVLAPAGRPIDAATIALLASAGHGRLRVVRRPQVAIVCSGDELIAVDASPGYGQIRNSNLPMLRALVEEAGADVVSAEAVADDRTLLRERLDAALGRADLTITTGGASAGERDYLKPVFAELGVEFAFTSVAMRPARPTGIGQRGKAVAAVLPGNPAAVFVAFYELVRPVIANLAGRGAILLPRVTAVLQEEVRARNERTFFVFARLGFRGGALHASVLDNQCSALTRLGAESQGLLVVPPSSRTISSGEHVAVDVFGWDAVRSEG